MIAISAHPISRWLLVLAVSLAACRGSPRSSSAASVADAGTTLASASLPPPPEMPHVAEVPVPGDRSAFMVRGARRHNLSMVFLAGLCAHPGGYLAAFPWTAVEHGTAIGIQGDVSCGGDGTFRKWSGDIAAIDRRIEAAFRAAGLEVPEQVAVIGYSQGAERAERLADLRPDRYTRLVLISSPIRSSPQRLARAKAVAIGIGELESRAATLETFRTLSKAGIPTSWFALPSARHGDMGPNAQNVMGEVLGWLEDPSATSEGEFVRTSVTGESSTRP